MESSRKPTGTHKTCSSTKKKKKKWTNMEAFTLKFGHIIIPHPGCAGTFQRELQTEHALIRLLEVQLIWARLFKTNDVVS